MRPPVFTRFPIMLESSTARPASHAVRWTGRVLTALPVLMLLNSCAMKFLLPAGIPEHFAELGWPIAHIRLLAGLELACTALYLIPRTALLGAVLLTAFLGGAAAIHVRIGDNVAAFPIVLGILLWGGLWLREPRLRALLPVR